MTSAIVVENLKKVFGRGKKQLIAVDDLSFEVAAGQVYGFLGPNGAGKSTTIRMILGLTAPTAGRSAVFGNTIGKVNPVLWERVGSLVDGGTFYPYMSGRNNLRVLARTSGCYDLKRIDELLALVGLTDAAERKAGKYSTGMKQRLGIAAALLNDPDLVILDEPTNGLDPQGIQDIRSLVRRLVEEFGKTVFLSSHLLYEVEQVCDRVAIIHQGQLLREGTVSELVAGQAILRLDVAPTATALNLLKQANIPAKQNGKAVLVKASREETPAIVQSLTENGVQIYEITPQRRTLEETFLEMTTHA